jgi:hypothetical protein
MASIPPPKPYIPPQQQLAAPPPGSDGSIYGNSNAIAANNAQAQNNLANIGKGGSRRRFKGGANNLTPAPIVVPPVQIPYKEAGAGSNTTSANVSNSTTVGATLNANSQFDACVGSSNPACGQAGGRKFKGGWPDWGCMSGGKRSGKRKSSKKSKSRRKCRKTRKCRRRKR